MAKQLCLVCASPTDEELQRVTGKTHDEDEDCSAIDKYFAERDKWIDANLSGIKFGEVIADGYGVIVAIGDLNVEIKRKLELTLAKDTEVNPFSLSLGEFDMEQLREIM